MKAFVYKAKIVRVVDGDTVDCDLDLGFSTILKKKRIRLSGINAPESRTRNLDEKKLGLAAKARLGVLYTLEGENINEKLVAEGHARYYDGGKRTGW